MSASERAMFELEHGDGVGTHFAHIAVKGHPLVEAGNQPPVPITTSVTASATTRNHLYGAG